MDFQKTGLLNDPMVEAAYRILKESKLDRDLKRLSRLTGVILSDDLSVKDAELVSAALLNCFTVKKDDEATADSDKKESFTDRVGDIVSAGKPITPEQTGFADLAAYDAHPLGRELKIIEMAAATAFLEETLPAMSLVIGLGPLASVFGDAADAKEARNEVREAKQEVREILRNLRTNVLPALGTTGETKLEQRLLESYNELADMMREPQAVYPAQKSTPPKPAAPTGP